ncbi:GNAT family N-acetyltransferase [Micromonospora sp. NPDC005710]|uniref:GNAT family N-acetyltransferase n=1 Tax=Micromonospora sp. NPDC005710 TaxID=3157051 RepID=UPI0033C8F5CC
MELTLTPVTEQDLARLLRALEQGYAEDLVAHRGMTPESALERSVSQVRESLPEGAATEGSLLRTGRVGDTEVGWIWVSLPTAAAPNQAWIHNIEVHEEHRGRGYARRMIQLIEAELAQHGVPELGLNVFWVNTVAVGLYRSLGFEVTSQQMVKRLTPSS